MCSADRRLRSHADLDRERSWKCYLSLVSLLRNSEVNKNVLVNVNARSLSRPEFLNLSLTISLYPEWTCSVKVGKHSPRHHSQPRVCIPSIFHRSQLLEALSQYTELYIDKVEVHLTYINSAKEVLSYYSALCSTSDLKSLIIFNITAYCFDYRTFPSFTLYYITSTCLNKTFYPIFLRRHNSTLPWLL